METRQITKAVLAAKAQDFISSFAGHERLTRAQRRKLARELAKRAIKNTREGK